ncbi:universal stress protein [Streptomyces sp. NPDC096040]|uniref:universal stress protein n=1 Tax=Streptomyces sp. NPDC096040 TaxID=3155541 RepID=UPI003324CDF7
MWCTATPRTSCCGPRTAPRCWSSAAGRGGFARALLGSVSQHVSQHAPCPRRDRPLPAVLTRRAAAGYVTAPDSIYRHSRL